MREPLFDSHAHLTFESSFDIEVIKRARDAGVTEIMNIAVDAPSLEKSFELAQQAPFLSLYHAAATTPHDLDGTDDSFFIVVQEAAKNGLLSAIGETGFDAFHRPHGGADQKVVFLRYANLALETGLPLIVHCRDAFDHLLRILREVPVKGVLHCFTGTEEDSP